MSHPRKRREVECKPRRKNPQGDSLTQEMPVQPAPDDIDRNAETTKIPPKMAHKPVDTDEALDLKDATLQDDLDKFAKKGETEKKGETGKGNKGETGKGKKGETGKGKKKKKKSEKDEETKDDLSKYVETIIEPDDMDDAPEAQLIDDQDDEDDDIGTGI